MNVKELEDVIKQIVKVVRLNTSSVNKNSAIEMCQELDCISASPRIRGYIDEIVIALAQQNDFCPICFDDYEYKPLDIIHDELDNNPIETVSIKQCKSCGYEN